MSVLSPKHVRNAEKQPRVPLRSVANLCSINTPGRATHTQTSLSINSHNIPNIDSFYLENLSTLLPPMSYNNQENIIVNRNLCKMSLIESKRNM